MTLLAGASFGHVSMRGSAGFALDDGEDDVYSTDFKSGYDFQLGGHNKTSAGIYLLTSLQALDQNATIVPGVTDAASDLGAIEAFSVEGASGCHCADGKKTIQGFHIGKENEQVQRNWQLPDAPRGFRSMHVFADPVQDPATGASTVCLLTAVAGFSYLYWKGCHSALSRQQLLGEERVQPFRPTEHPVRSGLGPTPEGRHSASSRVALLAAGISFTGFTELAEAMSKRFTKSSQGTLQTEGGNHVDLQQLDSTKPAEADPERTTSPWSPTPLLCKRFNVPLTAVSREAASSNRGRAPELLKDSYNSQVGPFLSDRSNAVQVGPNSLCLTCS